MEGSDIILHMDVWLDDMRPAPEGWTWVQTVDEVINLLMTGDVEALSLDNDLGVDQSEGQTVIYWMEENGYWPELLCVHTNNAVAGRNMRDAIQNSGHYQRPKPIEFRVQVTEADMPKMKVPAEANPFTPGTTVSFPALMFNLRVLTIGA